MSCLVFGEYYTIESNAFSDCNGLTNIVIPDGVTTIDSSAFAYCKGLTTIKLPSTLKKAGFGAVPEGVVFIVPRGYAAIYRDAFLPGNAKVVEE